jgi:nitrate reductase assembly molybdenum cofactor insertion protein NarJ
MRDDPMSQHPEAGQGGPAEFTPSHHAALDARQADQDRTLVAIHQVETALAAAAPGREGPWRTAVRAALEVLGQAATDEERNAAEPDSLLSDIARTQPHLRNRVRGLRAQYRQVRATIEALLPELDTTEGLDVADLRQRLTWLINALRHQRARESDLIYEAYFEAFNRDLDRDSPSS